MRTLFATAHLGPVWTQMVVPLMHNAGMSWAHVDPANAVAEVLQDKRAEALYIDCGSFPGAFRGAEQIIQQLRQQGCKLPIVALTGDDPIEVTDALEAGADDALPADSAHAAEAIVRLQTVLRSRSQNYLEAA